MNSNGIYPLEFTARFGYPTISIQHEGLLTPMGEMSIKLAEGSITRLRARTGFQVGVRIVVPPFPFNDIETFESSSKDAVILFKNPSREGFHIEDVRTRERRVDRHRHIGRRAHRVRHRIVHETGAAAGVQPGAQRDDPQHVLPRGHRRPVARGGQRPVAQLGVLEGAAPRETISARIDPRPPPSRGPQHDDIHEARRSTKIAGSEPAGSIYKALIERLKTIGPYKVEPKATSLHIVHGRAFLGVHYRKDGLLLNIVLDRPLEDRASKGLGTGVAQPLPQRGSWWRRRPSSISSLMGWVKEAHRLTAT